MGSISNHQKGTIQWFLAQQPAKQPVQQQEQPDPNKRPFKQPRIQNHVHQSCNQHLALRSSNHCQQLLAQQLGWRCPPSLNTWNKAQQQQLACICLRAVPTATGFRIGAKTSPITCLEVQQLPAGCSSSGHILVASGDAYGALHICRLSRLQAASASALNAAAALPADVREPLLNPTRWARQAMAAQGVPAGAGNIPTASARGSSSSIGVDGDGVLSFDTTQQLRSCCWLQQQHNGSAAASGSEAVLVTSGPGGLGKRLFTGDRVASSSLRAKGGSMVEAAGMVVSQDVQAAYQLCAVAGKSLLLWDLRVGPAAAASLPLQAPPAVVRAMPGGQVLLSAEGNGQVCLFDVRRLSSSSIVNFGSSRASQQLLLTHNLKARAQAAGFSSGGCSVLYGVAHEPQFLSDAVLNPADPNLLAYIKPNLQAGLFDLYSGQVLQQMSLVEQLSSPSANSSSSSSTVPSLHSGIPVSSAGGRGCWDSSGRVLYSQGFLQYRQDSSGGQVLEASPTHVAIDFGSWHGRKQRWLGSNAGSSGGLQEAGGSASGGECGAQEGEMERGVESGAGGAASSSQQQQQRWQGRRVIGQGGQVLHRELHSTAAPTAMTGVGVIGEVLVGTSSGDVLWLG